MRFPNIRVLRACICIVAGAMAPQLSSFPDDSDRLLLLIVALAIVLVIALPYLRRMDVVLFVGSGFLFWIAAIDIVESRLASEYEGDSLLTQLSVADFPRSNGRTVSFIATPIDDSRVPEKVLLSWQDPPVSVGLGDIWQLEVRLRRPRGNSNPGTQDYEAWLFRERVGASGYVVSGHRNVLLKSDTSVGLERLRINFLRKAQTILADDAAIAVVVAVAIGTRHLITADEWDRYARTGTSHLIAISGLHIGLAAIATYLLASGIFCIFGHRNHHMTSLVVALLVACAYAAISGFAVPARRALLMLAMVTALLVARREVRPRRILAAVAMAITLADPIAVTEPGFQLSFAAVAILFWFAKQTRARSISTWQRPLIAFRALVYMQFLLLIGLLPLTVLIFGRVSVVAPLINLIAVPLFSFVTVPFVLVSLALPDVLHAASSFVLIIAAKSIHFLEQIISLAAAYRFSSIYTASLDGVAALLLLLPIFWLVLPPGWPARHVAWLGVVSILLWRPSSPPADCVDIRVLDVGQGLSLVLETRDNVLVYDAGPSWQNGGSAGERVLLPYLRSRGITRVDRLMVSHSDLDHAGGVQTLIRGIFVGDILSGEELPWIGRPIRRCTAGMRWFWNGVRFSVLHPARSATVKGNDASCVLLVEAGDNKALLSGDIESATEAQLVRTRVLPAVDFVTVPHHGSRTSSIGPFVQSLTPSVAVVSASYGNRWGFPKPDVVARWRSTGAVVINTATSGSIGVRMCAKTGLGKPSKWRNERRRLWREDDS
jgi:competence protein ComEC